MIIEQTHFDMGTGAQDTRRITQREFNDLMGAYVINGVAVVTRWVYDRDHIGQTVVTVDMRGRIQYMFCIEEPMTA